MSTSSAPAPASASASASASTAGKSFVPPTPSEANHVLQLLYRINPALGLSRLALDGELLRIFGATFLPYATHAAAFFENDVIAVIPPTWQTAEILHLFINDPVTGQWTLAVHDVQNDVAEVYDPDCLGASTLVGELVGILTSRMHNYRPRFRGPDIRTNVGAAQPLNFFPDH